MFHSDRAALSPAATPFSPYALDYLDARREAFLYAICQ